MKKFILNSIVITIVSVYIITVNTHITSQAVIIKQSKLDSISSLINALENDLYKEHPQKKEQFLKAITNLVSQEQPESLALFKTDRNNQNLLEFAISYDYMPLIKKLIAKNFNVNNSNSRNSALSIASSAGNPEIVKLLIKAGAHVNVNQGSLPIISAFISKSINKNVIIKMLIAAGADIELIEENSNMNVKKITEIALRLAHNISNTDPNKHEKIALNNLLNSISKLEDAFKNNIYIDIQQENISPEALELFVMNKLNQNPSQLSALQNYFNNNNKNNSIVNILEKYKDLANPQALSVIQQTIRKEKQKKNLADQQRHNQFIDLEIINQA